MDCYAKQEEISVEYTLPFPKELTEGVAEMNVKVGTKFKNITAFVEKKFQDPNCRRIIFKGIGEATAKCISCVEVFKRNFKEELYQWNAVSFSRRSDVWVPNAGKEELSKLLVHVDVPTIFILVSRDPFPSQYMNDSCQSAFHEVTGFSDRNAKGARNSRSISKKLQPRKPMETNKWKRSSRRPTGSAANLGNQSSSNSKLD